MNVRSTPTVLPPISIKKMSEIAAIYSIYKIYKNLNLRKEVGIAIEVKKQVVSSNQLELLHMCMYIAIMHQPVTVSSHM